jgi:FkbM family methyltransferase
MKNISLNHLSNVEVNNIALGSEKGESVLLVVDEHNRGMNKIAPALVHSKGEKVKLNTIDDFIVERNITKLDLIKIDTEGFELHVLSGAANVLKKYRPILFIEVNDNNLREQGHSALQLVSFLKGIGYKIQKAGEDEDINQNTDFKNCHFDIVAI